MKLFLDDVRNPIDCVDYMKKRIGSVSQLYLEKDWLIVRNYPDFINIVQQHFGKLTHVSFDHDLSEYQSKIHKGYINYFSKLYHNDDDKTGWHAANYLKSLYQKNNLDMPVIIIHSINPLGIQNIVDLFTKKTK